MTPSSDKVTKRRKHRQHQAQPKDNINDQNHVSRDRNAHVCKSSAECLHEHTLENDMQPQSSSSRCAIFVAVSSRIISKF